MAEYPIDHQSAPIPLSFAYVLAEVWCCLYPSGEMPRYQVFQTPLGGLVLEYRANVFMAVNLSIGRRTYNFHGGYASTPDRVVQLAALVGLTGLRHQESAMHQNRAYHFYPTLATIPQQVRFPRPLAEADAAVVGMSRYMIAEYALIVELVRDANLARRALAAALASLTPPPALAASRDPSLDRSA